jgi:ubiquinone/menaquinone biosynthesis C-methylase UbiE
MDVDDHPPITGNTEVPLSYTKDEAHVEFTRWSKSYDRSILQTLLFGPSRKALLKRIREQKLESPRILDIGCGTGQFPELLFHEVPGSKIWALDLVRGMLEGGNERWNHYGSRVVPVQGDSENLPFETGTFDILTCANSFHHYPNQAKAVAEMCRVLKPGGCLMLIDGYRDAPWGWFIYDLCVATVEGNVHHASAREIQAMMGSAGFGKVDQFRHRGPAPFLLTLARKPETKLPRPHILNMGKPEEAGLKRQAS